IGLAPDYRTPLPTGRIIIRDNLIESPSTKGILMVGALRDVHVVGNRIRGAGLVGIQLEPLAKDTRAILIANNTVFECQEALGLWDESGKGKDFQIRNNLCLASKQPDLVVFNSGGNRQEPHGPGDGKALHKVWRMDHNWREARIP